MSECISIVEYLRDKMVHKAEMRGELANPDVVCISQRLDLFILQSQKQRMADGDNGLKGQVVYDMESSVQLARG